MPVILSNKEYAALVAAQSERDILKARIEQCEAMDKALDDKELVPNGDVYNDVLTVLRHGPYASFKLQTHMGDASFTFNGS